MRSTDHSRWWSGLFNPAPPSSIWVRYGIYLYRLVLVCALISLMTYLSPSQRPYQISELRIGSVAQERIIAPFFFFVHKNLLELERERREAAERIPTLLDLNKNIKQQQLANLDSVYKTLIPNIMLQMPDSLKQRRLQRTLPQVIGSLSETAYFDLINAFLEAPPEFITEFQEASRQVLANTYSQGIIDSTKEDILNDITDQISLNDQIMPLAAIYSAKDLKQGRLIPIIESFSILTQRSSSASVQELLSLFITANLTKDSSQTQRLRLEARRGVPAIKAKYAQDQMIIDKNMLATSEHVEALNALADKIKEKDLEAPTRRLIQTASAAIVATFFVLIFGYYLSTRETDTFNRPSHLLLITLITAATAAMASYILTHDLQAYLVPIPLAAMLLTILLNPQIGLVFSLMIALFVGNLFGDFAISLICALTGAIVVFSVRHVRHRNQFYLAMILLPLSYSLLIGTTNLLRFVSFEEIYQILFPGIFIVIAFPIFTIGLLPIFESLFHITTDITLLELSDQNRPLLRDLAMRAPGTYTHSLNMANLSETAAEAIGANPLLARVGCYYHDIGKMLKPEYFTENQGLRGGHNPHDHLTPNMSTLIIASHVKDGLELAEEHGLPIAIAHLIPQHHGTTVIEYFYQRAIELGLENVRQDDFRYDGPKPQTKEAGILMLADAVESAARSLNERTPNRVRQLVRQIIHQRFSAGELDECDLTLQDLHRIEDSFIPVLMGTLHNRIQYPWQKKTERKVHKDLGNTL
jgi:hypothetical protein